MSIEETPMKPETDASPRIFEDSKSVVDIPSGVDRRSFRMRSAVISAAA
jgi:hypothetical protein